MSPAGGAAATGEDAAPACRFVPEAMRDAGAGTLIAQHSCGMVGRPERLPSHLTPATVLETLVCDTITWSDVRSITGSFCSGRSRSGRHSRGVGCRFNRGQGRDDLLMTAA